MSRSITLLSLVCFTLLTVGSSYAQDYSGTYTLTNQKGGVTSLTLRQDAQGNVTGTMSGNGNQYQVEGIVEEGFAVGAIYDQQGGVYFEAELQGNQLLLTLIEVGANNEPDYTRTTDLVLNRQGVASAPATERSGAAGANPLSGNPLAGGDIVAGSYDGDGLSLRLQAGPGGYTGTLTFSGQDYPVEATAVGSQLQGTFAAAGQRYAFQAEVQGEVLTLVSDGNSYRLTRAGGVASPSGNPLSGPATGGAGAPAAGAPAGGEVGDPSWGFGFTPPAGWKVNHDPSGAVLAHDRVPGMILVMPHQQTSLQAVAGEMQEGLQEEGLMLRPTGAIGQKGAGILAGEYGGIVQGQQAKAHGIGTLSPHGGGAYILAMTTPEQYGAELQGAAEALAASLRYFKVEVSDLVQHFIGKWAYVSDRGSTLKNLTLAPDGTFEWVGETSIVYETPTDVTTGYGKHQGSQGRWTVRGTKDAGQLILAFPNGEQRAVEYQVHVENGQVYYNNYRFDGFFYIRCLPRHQGTGIC